MLFSWCTMTIWNYYLVPAINGINKIDFLKVDIEGAEHAAFAGISDDNLMNIWKTCVDTIETYNENKK